MKILVVIANYGLKNQAYLKTLINEYKSMSYDVDIVILSNVPKELGSGIEVRVGLPAKNPWSLPFGHKELQKVGFLRTGQSDQEMTFWQKGK